MCNEKYFYVGVAVKNKLKVPASWQCFIWYTQREVFGLVGESRGCGKTNKRVEPLLNPYTPNRWFCWFQMAYALLLW